MVTKERKEELIRLARSVGQTVKKFTKTPEEAEFVINTMVKAEGYATTIGMVVKKCMKVLEDTLFKE